MKKVTVMLKIRVAMSMNDGIEVSDVVNELDYSLFDTTTTADILDYEIVDFDVTDSKQLNLLLKGF